ncbi:hypothetical protein CANINC_003854 [Pichia inconspicua]|uniref:Nucleoporin Pom152 n=1 Tax=Pichia inconspicua TaxID=52247 RepID=A0A4T0WXQ0_9ASCO|nr:hypothetical protein CANINC_003854 [[Candida] inconspicua]
MSVREKKQSIDLRNRSYSGFSKRVHAIKPVIPESILDADSQRYYVLALFALVQAWKIYDLLFLQNNLEPSDFAAEFTNKEIGSTFTLSITSVIFSLYKLLVPDKELTILENFVDADSIYDQSEHFKGKKIIRYAPDSSVRINPYDQKFCIRPIYNDKIKIPIKVDSVSELVFLQLEHHDFNNEVTLFNFTSKEIKHSSVTDHYNSPYFRYDPSVLADSNIQLLEITVDLPGHYSVRLAKDKKNKHVRSFNSNIVIPVCPEAYFNIKQSFLPDKCQDDLIDDVEITILGVPPFTLYYEEEVNGHLSKLSPKIINHPDHNSPLNSNESSTKNISLSNQFRNASQAKSYNITLSMTDHVLKGSGSYIYTINKIVDGFGNTISYTPDPRDSSTFISFISHPKPLLNLIDLEPNIPILLGREKWLNITLQNVRNAAQESPFDIRLKFVPKDEGIAETIVRHFDLKTINEMSIQAKNPGSYFLERGSSKYCECIIGKKSVKASLAMLPSMDVSLEPKVDNCVGTTGFKFNFNFVGSPPFEISYKISQLDPKNPDKVLRVEKISKIISDTFTQEFDFEPSNEGSYAIELISLSDKYYKDKVKFSRGEYRYVTYFKQKPKAYFRKNKHSEKWKCCFGDFTSIPLMIEGTPPFDIKYDLVFPDRSYETFELKNLSATDIIITTPKLNNGGDYTLILREVHDSSDCDVDFKGQEALIKVNDLIPEISFFKNDYIKIAKGSFYVASLQTESNQPVDLTYLYTDPNKTKSEKVKLKSYEPSQGLKLFKEGFYRLISIEQDGCPGKIAQDYEIAIQYLSFPSIKTIIDNTLKVESENSFIKDTVCLNRASNITFEISGSSPFVIEYQVIHPNGKIEERMEKTSSSNFDMILHTQGEGVYRYVIRNVYDSVYTRDVLNSLKYSSSYTFTPLTFTHKVSALPSAKFTNVDRKIQTCVSALNELNEIEPMKVSIEGSLPATLKVDIYREIDGSLETLVFENLQSSIIDLLTIKDHIGKGTNIITVNQVIDATGCVSNNISLSSESITIFVNDVPKIRQLIDDSNQPVDLNFDLHHYCVGDQISYILNGVPPFSLKYEFNGVEQEVEIHSNYFRRRAPLPGELNIISLSDSSAKECIAYFGKGRNDLKAIVYDLPSVEIIQGENIEEDIHEGEQAEIMFSLTGTPPFRLTYIRKELEDNSKIVESEIVEDIQDREYRIMANLEGTYEAVEIQDRFCVARNHRI